MDTIQAHEMERRGENVQEEEKRERKKRQRERRKEKKKETQRGEEGFQWVQVDVVM